MKIEEGTVVGATYVLHTLNENGEEVFVERADKDNPLVFLYGAGNMLPKFEEYLAGLQPGDTYKFELTADEGYGEKNPEAQAALPIDMFKEMGVPKAGDILPLQDDSGNAFRAAVTAVGENEVTVDLNHPMAGQVLRFTGEILDVRKASDDEIHHGHAHGMDGHSGH